MRLNNHVGTETASQRVAQLLGVLVFGHQRFDARHVAASLFQLSLQVLQVLADDVHAEVENQVLYALAQVALALLHLEAAAELMAVNA